MRIVSLTLAVALLAGCRARDPGFVDEDVDADGFDGEEDCDDTRNYVHVGAPELCNGLDDDCDGQIDERDSLDATATLWWADADGDGAGDPNDSVNACEAPDGFVANSGDCDDANDAIGRGLPERCNGIDDDCDDQIDEVSAIDARPWFADIDGDGAGDAYTVQFACAAPEGFVGSNDDCDDDAATAYPGADELCNSADDDCDGLVDEALPSTPWHGDVDGDGFGSGAPSAFCGDPGAGWAPSDDDCADSDPLAFPGATERCNGLDDDCDGLIDNGKSSDGLTLYEDTDGDGFGKDDETTLACASLDGWAEASGDCDDDDPDTNPGQAEQCDGSDEDCSGTIDDNPVDGEAYNTDLDGDGFAGGPDPVYSCTPVDGRVADSSDCDDDDDAVNPDADELCNQLDDNCDGAIDEDGAADAPTWAVDSDGDGFGQANGVTLNACEAPDGYANSDTDCNDGDSDVFPGALESCNNEDDDCDLAVDEDAWNAKPRYRDADEDGYGSSSQLLISCGDLDGWITRPGDCDDGDDTVHPGIPERCNAADDDCDGDIDEDAEDGLTWYIDADTDGFGTTDSVKTDCAQPSGFAGEGGDCDDDDPDIHPHNEPFAEIPFDGVDQDCNGWDQCVDLNCDDETDLVIVAPSQPWRVRVYYGQRSGSRYSTDAMDTYTVGANATGAAAGQLTDDGYLDLVTAWGQTAHPLQVHSGDEDLERADDGVAFNDNPVNSAPLSADLDADGYGDIVAIGNPTWIHYGPWIDGKPAESQELRTGVTGRAQLRDINADNLLDLVVARDNKVTAYTGDFAGFSTARATDLPMITFRDATPLFALADYNNDGWDDVAVAFHNHCCSGESRIYWGSADGLDAFDYTGFTTPVASDLDAGDQDGDGVDDLMMVMPSARGACRIFRGADGERPDMSSPITFATPTGSISAAGWADFDRDGDQDLLYADSNWQGGRYLEWTGSGFETRGSFSNYRGSVVVAELNGDHYPDAVYAGDRVYYGGPGGLGSGSVDSLGFDTLKQIRPTVVVVGRQ